MSRPRDLAAGIKNKQKKRKRYTGVKNSEEQDIITSQL